MTSGGISGIPVATPSVAKTRLEIPAPVLLVGAGNMGGALLRGWLDAGLLPSRIFIQDPALKADLADVLKTVNVKADAALPRLPESPAVVVVAVKPQVMESVLPTLVPQMGPDTLVLSIAAGWSLARIAAYFPSGTAVARAMPNMPAAIRRGITVCCGNAHVGRDHAAVATLLLEAVGEVTWIADESLMNAVTAVSGSGPAYVFLLAEALAEAGCAAGLDPALAERLARATVGGSGDLLTQSPLDAATLRRNVTSPGGTTAAALEILDGPEGLRPLLTRAVAAATRRGQDLGA